MNPTDDEVETIKKEIDEDESGEIDFAEFLEIMNCRTLRLVVVFKIIFLNIGNLAELVSKLQQC